MAQIKLAEYTFDNSVGDCLPTLTPNTITMTTEDTVNDTTTRRIIYIDDATMPTNIKFAQYNSLLTVDYINMGSHITSCGQMFYRSTSLKSINTSNWDLPNVTSYERFIMSCSKLESIDFSFVTRTKTVNFYRAFEGLNVLHTMTGMQGLTIDQFMINSVKLKTLDLTGTTMIHTSFNKMFNNCQGLTEIKGIENWDVSSVTDFSFMFQKCSSLTKLDLRNWVTSSATTMQGMFHSCSSLTEIKGIENFNVSSVTTFGSMFYLCKSLTKLDLRSWVTSSATTFQDMFASCHNLEVIRVDNFDTSKATDTGLNAMFSYCKKVKTLNLNSFVNAGLGNFLNFCYNCESLEYISAQNFIWGNCNAMQGVFTNCKSLKMLDLTNFDGTTIASTDLNGRLISSFNGVTCPIYYNSNMCTQYDTALTSLSNAIDVQGRLMAVYDFSNEATTSDSAYPTLTGSTVVKTIDTQGSESYITHRVISVDVMPTAISFKPISGLLNVDYLAVTSSCTSLGSLFENCFRMTYVDTFGWDTSNVTSFGYCFRTCSSLAEIRNIQDLKVTSKVTAAYDFFHGCSKLTSLDLTHWDVSGIINGSVMFRDCSGLTSLNISNWDVSSIQYGNSMFQGCTSLSELDLTSFKTTAMESDNYNMFDSWTSDQIVYIHDTNWTIDVSSYNATFVRRLSTLLARYTFDNSIGDCLPTFTGITTSDYLTSDIVNDTITTRLLSTDSDKTITKISFGSLGSTSSLLTLDYLKIDKNITQMNDMFQVCSNVTTINAQDWDTSNVTNMGYLFQSCGSLTEVIGLETWDTSKVEYMNQMFISSKVPNVSAILNWNVSNCKSFAYMFGNSNALDTELNLSNWQPNSLENCQNMFTTTSFTSINLSGWSVPKLSNMSSMFAGAGTNSNLLSVDMSNWTMETPANMNSMFYNNGNLTSIDFTGSKIVSSNLQQTFQSCVKLTSLDVSGFDTSQCTNMGLTFSLSSKLTTLTGIENWVTDNVTAMNDMFNGLTQITELNLANWDTRKVVSDNTNMFRSWTSDQTIYYEPPYWSIGTTTLNPNINWVIQITRNNGYWLDMTGITEDTTITLYNENNLATEEILTDWGDGTQDSELTHTYSTAGEYVVVSNLQNGNTNSNIKGYLTKAIIYYCTTPASLFFTCAKLKEVNLTDNWVEKTIAKYGKNVSLSQVFYGCTNLETANTIQLTKFKPTHMVGTFYNCKKIKEIDLTGLDTSSTKGFNNCFAVCETISEVKGMENWDTSSATDMSSMFAFSFIPTLNLSSWDFSKVTTMYQFAKNSRITSIDLSNATFNNTRFTEFLYNNLYITSVNLSGTNISGDMESMFLNCSKLENINLTNAIIKPSSLKQTFGYCGKLTSLDTERIDVSSCKSMESTFKQCSSLTSLDLTSWDVSQCTNMASTFNSCSSLTSLDLTSWNTSQCTSMYSMFAGCSSLTSLNLTSWNTDNVTNTNLMFNNCSSIEKLDLSNFTTTKLTDIAYMLERCSSLKTLDISNFNLDNFSSTQMFYSTKNIESIGLLYVSSHTVNLISQQILKDNTNLQLAPITIYYYDADPSQLTPVEGVTFKKYAMPTTIQLPPHIQLHSLPDGTRDEVDIRTGILTRNVGCYDMIKVNDDRTQTYYVLDEEIIEKVEPRITDTEGNEITLSEFLNTSIESPTANENTTYVLDENNKLIEAKAIANDYGKLDNYYILNSTSRQLTLANLGSVTMGNCSDAGSKGILVTHSGTPNVIRFDNIGLEVGRTYEIKVEIESKSYYQKVNNCRMVNPSSSVQYANIFTELDDTNLDGSLVLQGKYTHQNANYSSLSISVRGGLSDTSNVSAGSYYVRITISEGSGENTGLIYENIGLNSVLNYKDELNLITGEITRRIGVRDYKQGEEYNMLPTRTPNSYTTYKKEKLIAKLTTPTTEQLILNYNNSCDYGRILPTGMCDKYDVVNSMYTQTMTSILLDGENTWDAMEEMTNVVKFTATGTTVGVEELNMLGAGGLYCDNDLFPNINDDSDVEHCRVDEAGNKFYIYISKDRLMSPDLIGYQIWLQENNFNLIYELAEHLTYVKPYEELDATQARWEGMDCMRDGAISYHTNSSDNITMYPTLEYVAPSINNFEVTMLEPNTNYTIYAEGINANDTINLGGNDINFNNGTVYTSGDNQWLRIDNNDSFYNMVITKGDTTGEVVPYFEGMTSVENPKVNTQKVINGLLSTAQGKWESSSHFGGSVVYVPMIDVKVGQKYIIASSSRISVAVWRSKTWVNNDVTQIVMADVLPDSPLIFTPDVSQVAIFMVVASYLTDKAHEVELRMYEGEVDYGYVGRVENPKVIIESSKVSYTDLKLRSLPNGVKDTINVVTGEYVQRIGEIVFDGSEDWTRSAHTNSTMFYTPLNDLVHKEDYLNIVNCDKLVMHTDSESLYDSTLPNGISAYVDWTDTYPNENWIYIKYADSEGYVEKLKQWLQENPVTVQYELAEPITTKLDSQTLLAYIDGTINLSSNTGLLPTTHYTVPSTNTFHLPSMKTGTRYTLKYPSASGSITIGDINYSISSDSMLFTTPLKINGDTSAIIFSDSNPENVVLLEGAYNKREVPFFTGVKSVKNPNITIIDQLSTESTTYNCETEIELRGLPNGVADKLDIVKGKLTTNVGIRPYQEGDEELDNIWTDGYETVYALSSPVVTNVTIDQPTVTTNSLIELSSDYLIPQLNYRAPSSNNFPLDLLQSNSTYTLYADTLTSGSFTLGGTYNGVFTGTQTIILGDVTDNLLTFNGDLGLSNVMLVKGNSLKTTLPPYFLGIRSVTDGHLLVEGMAGEMNEITFDEGIVLRDCNGVKDVIDLTTGILTKRTGEITLTGAEGWYRADNESTTDHNVFKLTLGGLKEALVMCDTLQSVFDTKMMDCIHAHTNELCIVIANATIGGNTVNALKSWLNQHPTTVVYQLRTPIEVQLENTWTTLPPTSYDNQTEISSTVSTNSLKPMISVTIATTTLEEIVSDLEAQNAQLEEENMATMLALTSVYETLATPATVATMSLDDEVSTVNLSDGKDGNNVNGMSVSPIGMVYVNLIRKGLKTIEQVPYNLQPEVMYALRGME